MPRSTAASLSLLAFKDVCLFQKRLFGIKRPPMTPLKPVKKMSRSCQEAAEVPGAKCSHHITRAIWRPDVHPARAEAGWPGYGGQGGGGQGPGLDRGSLIQHPSNVSHIRRHSGLVVPVSRVSGNFIFWNFKNFVMMLLLCRIDLRPSLSCL